MSEDEPQVPANPRLVSLEQRRHLRRILLCFLAVVILLPLSALGDAWAWLFVPMLVLAAVGLREAVRLRRTVTRSAPQ
jgi:hypothetical protein